jgi:hypothetical protein
MYKFKQSKVWVKNIVEHVSTTLYVLEIARLVVGLSIPSLSGLIGQSAERRFLSPMLSKMMPSVFEM